MLKWLEYKDWRKAFLEVIPQRKFESNNSNDDPDAADNDVAADVEPAAGNIKTNVEPLESPTQQTSEESVTTTNETTTI